MRTASMARYESAVLTQLGLYVQLVAEPAEGTREAAEALFNGTFELTDGEGAPLDAEIAVRREGRSADGRRRLGCALFGGLGRPGCILAPPNPCCELS